MKRVLAYLQAGLFSAGLIVTLCLCLLAILFTLPCPYRVRYAIVVRWAHWVIDWLTLTCGVGYRVEGAENIPAEPVVILSKHQSTWETFAYYNILPPLAWVMKRELYLVPVFGWGLALMKFIAIDRAASRQAAQQLIAQGKKRLAEGFCVLIFPEGTRVAPGQRKRYRAGGAKLALAAGVRILPVAHNAGEHWGRKAFLKTPGEIRVVIGVPIETAGKSAERVTREAEGWIEETVARISQKPVVPGGPPAGSP